MSTFTFTNFEDAKLSIKDEESTPVIFTENLLAMTLEVGSEVAEASTDVDEKLNEATVDFAVLEFDDKMITLKDGVEISRDEFSALFQLGLSEVLRRALGPMANE